jgi:hypothetical protein
MLAVTLLEHAFFFQSTDVRLSPLDRAKTALPGNRSEVPGGQQLLLA